MEDADGNGLRRRCFVALAVSAAAGFSGCVGGGEEGGHEPGRLVVTETEPPEDAPVVEGSDGRIEEAEPVHRALEEAAEDGETTVALSPEQHWRVREALERVESHDEDGEMVWYLRADDGTVYRVSVEQA